MFAIFIRCNFKGCFSVNHSFLTSVRKENYFKNVLMLYYIDVCKMFIKGFITSNIQRSTSKQINSHTEHCFVSEPCILRKLYWKTPNMVVLLSLTARYLYIRKINIATGFIRTFLNFLNKKVLENSCALSSFLLNTYMELSI